MNWYKKAQDKILKDNLYYTDIGHPENDPENEGQMILWISDLSGGNFHKAEARGDAYDHAGLSYDIGLTRDIERGTIQGRYDEAKNIVSLYVNPRIATIREIPNRLMNRLYQEFGNNITIIDYSGKPPKRIV